MHHDLFWRLMAITNNNQRIMDVGGDYLAWFKNSYIEAGSVAFRRQLDRDRRSVSLINLLLTIRENHTHFTKEGFQRKNTFCPESPFHDEQKWNDAGATFNAVFGNGGHLDSAIVQADIDLLEKESAAIKEQVNKEIAHRDRKGMQGAKATGDIFEHCITLLDGMISKYSHLLDGKPLDSVRPRYLFDVEEVFTFAWKQ